MPQVPYPVSGQITGIGGATTGATVTSVSVTAYNQTNNEWLADQFIGVSNSSGQYTIDLANLKTPYAEGDVIFLVFFKRGPNNEIAQHAEYRFTISLAAGMRGQNAVMHPGPVQTGDGRVLSVIHSNSHSAGLEAQLYDRRNDMFILRLNAAAGDSAYCIWPRGKRFYQGLGVIYEDDTDGRSTVSIQTSSQSGN